MGTALFDSRFFESTRGRIVDLLRRGSRTVEDLAAELDVTDNAIRLHLSALERDGVVRQAGVRRGVGAGKPATLYEISPAAEPAFSKAYLPFLSTLLETMGDRLDTRELRAIMRDVGKRLASAQSPRAATIAERAELASSVLNELGGITTVETDDDGYPSIKGCGCPLSVAVSCNPDVCLAVRTMVQEIVGAEVAEHCDRSGRPQCCFQVLEAS
jgi:predicted ArsR family transcriptional regulator